ncbi:MAG: hypothetical protein ABSH33_15005 [Steroidobacteraceae bacterium]|jgi:hypothetical protein
MRFTAPAGQSRQDAPMWRHPVLKFALLAYVVWGGWNWWISRPVHPAAGVLAAAEPDQGGLRSPRTYHVDRWTLTPRASYQITARILGVERYHFDFLSALIPEDLALGWGPMSDSRVLDNMQISQDHRFYFWRTSSRVDLPKDVIVSHSANTHVIPANPRVERELSRLRRGQVVTLTGLLVDGTRDDGAWIKTSLVRTDTGAGACEVMLVQDVNVMR